MKIVIVLLMVIVVDCLQTRQIKEINQRPQYISYSNNILHHNPEYPDQRSESNVRVSYNYNNNNNGVARINHNYNQQPLINQQSQLFNVGYSVKFANNNNNNHKHIDNSHQVPKQRLKYNDGEIITGTRKQNEQVQVPEFNMSPQQFVSNALIESKKSKLSGIKTKFQQFQQPISIDDSQLLIKQANLSPTTQKFYKNLEHVRVPQQSQSQQQYSQQQKYTWQNLSPSVEIIQSAEIPVKYADNEAQHFDHSKALGKSEEFDYTNIMNLQQQQQQQSKPSNIVTQVPVDTSLLQEPVRIDTRLVQEAIRQNYETNQSPYVPKYQIASQIYSNDNNLPKFPYKIYGQSPQLLEQTERQPRFVQVQYNLQRDLQPPPLYNSRYQRRISG